MKKFKIIQWGAGFVGVTALRYILGSPVLELVGVRCYTEAKEGKDVSDIIGGNPTGIQCTRNVESLLALDADCVVFMPADVLEDPSLEQGAMMLWLEELDAILRSGKNVITSLCAGSHWRHMARGDHFRNRMQAACEAGNSTVHFGGFDPGFTTDALSFLLSSVVGEIEQIRAWEFVDADNYTGIETLKHLGFGVRPEDIPPGGANAVLNGWGGPLHLMADGFGVEIEEIKSDFDMYVAPETFTTVGGLTINQGTISAIRWSLAAVVNGRPRFSINHVTRARWDCGPDWPNIGTDGGYRVEIDAFPPLRCDFPMALPGGTGSSFADAMAMTAARCVNAIEAVVEAPTGYLTFRELKPIGGKLLFGP